VNEMYQSKFWLRTYWISLGAYPSFKKQIQWFFQAHLLSIYTSILFPFFWCLSYYIGAYNIVLVFCFMLLCWWCPSYLMQQAQPMLKFFQPISPLLVCWIFFSIFSMRKEALDFPTLWISVYSMLLLCFLVTFEVSARSP